MMAGEPRKEPPAQSFLVNYKALKCKHQMTNARNGLLLDGAGLRVPGVVVYTDVDRRMRKQRGVIVLETVIFFPLSLLLLLPHACLPACLSGARPPPRSLLFISPGSSPPILGQTKQHPWVSERLTGCGICSGTKLENV